MTPSRPPVTFTRPSAAAASLTIGTGRTKMSNRCATPGKWIEIERPLREHRSHGAADATHGTG